MVKIKTFIFDNRFDGGTVEIELKEISRKELTRIIEFLDEIEGGRPAEQASPVQETHIKPVFKLSGETKTGKRKASNWKHIEEEITKTLKDKGMTRKEILKYFDRNKAIVIKLLIKMERSGALKTEQIDKFGTKRYSLPSEAKKEQKPVEIELNYANLRQALWDAYESNEKAVWAKDFKKCDIMTKGSPEALLNKITEDSEFRAKLEESMGLRLSSSQDCLMITGMMNTGMVNR